MTIQYTGNDFRIGLIDAGTESGTWGGVTNSNLEQFVKVIGGFKQITGLSGTSGTLAAPAANTSDQDFRNMFLELDGSSSGEFTYTVPDSEKIYIIKNSLNHTVTVKVSGQTGTTIPKDKTAIVYVNGTDAVTAIDSIPNLAIGSATITTALGVPSGGTGKSSVAEGSIVKGAGTGALVEIVGTSAGQVLKWDGTTWEPGTDSGGSGGGSVSLTANGSATASGVSVVLDPTTTTGTGTIGLSGTVNMANVSGTLPIANGGTGATSPTDAGIINNANTSLQKVVSNFQIDPSGGDGKLFFGSSTSNPEFIKHTINSNGNGQIEVFTNNTLRFAVADVAVSFLQNIGAAASGLLIGSTNGRFSTIFLVNQPDVSSDKRLKNNIQDTDIGLDFINSLKPKKFKLNDQEEDKFHYGLIAQEVEAVLDEKNIDKETFAPWVLSDSKNPDSDQSLVYGEFMAPMMKAIQELSDEVKSLKEKVKSLEEAN